MLQAVKLTALQLATGQNFIYIYSLAAFWKDSSSSWSFSRHWTHVLIQSTQKDQLIGT